MAERILNRKMKLVGRQLGQYSRWALASLREQNEAAKYDTPLEKEMAVQWGVSNLYAPPNSEQPMGDHEVQSSSPTSCSGTF